MINIFNTIISQYKNSPRLRGIIEKMYTHVNPAENLAQIKRDIWDIRTAAGWGLDNWGRILNISRTYQMEDGTVHVLEDDQYRSLLYLKAASNISDCSVEDINRILQDLFQDQGTPYVVEVDLLYLRYVFDFGMEDWQRALLRHESLIPRPATVGFEILEYDAARTFGFYVEGLPNEEQPWKPFAYGVFGEITYSY